MINRSVILFILFALALSCSLPQPKRKKIKAKAKVKQAETELPVLMFRDTTDRRFALTNKKSGLFSGHSRDENTNPKEGWLLDNTRIFLDYQIFTGGHKIARKKAIRFSRLPFGFTRFYKNGMVEKFLMVDSINALVVQIENQADVFLNVQTVTRSVKIGKDNPRFLSGDNPSLELYFQKISDGISRFWFSANHSLNEEERSDAAYRNLIKNAVAKAKQKPIKIANKALDQAALWAGLTLNAFTGFSAETELAGKNIREQEVLRSFTGALLLRGKFAAARNLLKKYASTQLTNKSRREFGRLMNRIADGDAIYNSAGVTWRYIRALYDYYLFSGDSTLVTELFPVVRRAVEGALKQRCNKNFLLTHGETETWMDTRAPRGNRAVEIQALWYTALQISAKLAQISGAENALSSAWLGISRRLKQNFNRAFWDADREALYDHLNSGGQPDTSLRPNQIFAVAIPDMYGVEPLLSRRRQRAVSKIVAEKLTLPAGVLTLSPNDQNFHPFYHYQPYYSPQAARFNGMIWSGLSGAVISSLVKFGQMQTTQEILINEAQQVLYGDPPGSLAQLTEPVARSGKREPPSYGLPESMWGLAEFQSNLLEDILGYHPAAADSLIVFKPRLPGNMGSIQTRVPYKTGWISVLLATEKGTMDIRLSSEVNEKVYGRLQCPGGQPAVDFMLQDSGTVFQYTYVPRAKPEIPPSKIPREWTLARIDNRRSFPVLANPEYDILKGREIFLPPGKNGYTLLFKRDAPNDAYAVAGKKAYRGNGVQAADVPDLESFTIYDMPERWGFRINLRRINANNKTLFLAFMIRDKSVNGTLKNTLGPAGAYRLPKKRAFNRIIFAGREIEIQNGSGKRLARFAPVSENFPIWFETQSQVRFMLPKKYLPGLNAKSVITVFAGTRDKNAAEKCVSDSETEYSANGFKMNMAAITIYDRMEIN